MLLILLIKMSNENMKEKKLVFGYVRSSTIFEYQQGSNTRQRAIIKKYSDQHNYEVKFFEDKGVSGKNTNRPGLQNLMSNLDHDKPQVLIVSKIDRLARSLIDLLNVIEILQKQGIGFISVMDSGIDTTTSNGKLMLQIIGVIAEFERNLIYSRTQAGRKMAMEKGVKFGRPALKTKKGSFIDKKKVIEYKDKGLSASAISKLMDCSITPILKIIHETK